MNNKKIIEIREKILKGIELAFEKLIKAKQMNNGDLVFSKDGKIIIIKANQLKKH